MLRLLRSAAPGRVVAALAVAAAGVLGLPGVPATPGPAPVEDTAIPLADPGTAKARGWRSVVDVPDGTESVALAWDGAPTGEVRLRSHDASGWSAWVDLHADPTHAPDDGTADRTVVGPVWVGAADAVEVSVEDGPLAGLTLHALRIGEVPEPPPGAVEPAAAAIANPGILPRSLWGAADWSCSDPPSSARLRFAVLHHTVTTNAYGAEQAAAQIRSVQYTHQRLQGYCDIAYNFVVDRFGRIWEGRAGGIDRAVVGGHSKGFNTGSVGVVLLGQHHRGASPPAASVSSAARDAVVALLRWKFAHHGVDAEAMVTVRSLCDTSTGPCRYPAGTEVTLPTIVGHRDVQLTSCPGDLAYPIVAAIRDDVGRAVAASGPFFPLPGWEPEPGKPAVVALDAWGGIHPAGSATAVRHTAFWPGWRAARAIAGDAQGGWVLDLYGGLHAYGSAPRVQAPLYLPGRDIARSAAGSPSTGQGYVLDAYGGLHAFGGAPPVFSTGYWFGWDIARDITLRADGRSGWKLDGFGGIHAFGGAPRVTDGPYWHGWDVARAIAANPAGSGGWVLDGFGGVHAFGGAPRISGPAAYRHADVFRDLVMISGTGGYAIDVDGIAWPVGDAPPIEIYLTSVGTDLGLGLAATTGGR